jgi:hypothetical protein
VAKAKKSVSSTSGTIRIGVGGWTFPPWRSTFYPPKLAHAKELEYAASKLTSIEINGTYCCWASLLRTCVWLFFLFAERPMQGIESINRLLHLLLRRAAKSVYHCVEIFIVTGLCRRQDMTHVATLSCGRWGCFT